MCVLILALLHNAHLLCFNIEVFTIYYKILFTLVSCYNLLLSKKDSSSFHLNELKNRVDTAC